MNRKELISKTAEVLRTNNIRKPVKFPRQVFHISDDEGNSKDFWVKKTDKTVPYKTEDVATILDTCIQVIIDSIRRGEEVRIPGFGVLELHYRAAREAILPSTGERVKVAERLVPKFTYGKHLRLAAKMYDISRKEGDTDEKIKEEFGVDDEHYVNTAHPTKPWWEEDDE